MTEATQKTNQAVYLKTAHNIGKYLAKEAIWYKDQCNWTGHEVSFTEGSFQNVVKACGMELYSGLSGVALFLGELCLQTQDPIIFKTLTGTVNTIINHVDKVEMDDFAYYSGRLGVGITLFKLGQQLNNEQWASKGINLIKALQHKEIKDHEIDIIAGAAGAIPALVKLYSIMPDPVFLEIATKCGDFLISKADKGTNSWSWKTVDPQHALTGYSHGASGIALALLELYTVTQNQTYWDAAMAGFQFEKEWYSEQHQNWPDLRQYSRIGAPNYGIMWCHGAPGIALAHLKAYKITQHDYFLQEALTALNTTSNNVLKECQPSSGANFSLCHGLAGNADVLLYAHQILNKPEFEELARKAGDLGIQLYDNTNTLFPSGVNDPSGATQGRQENPGLMLGLSGTGYFYLRLANCNVLGTALMP